MIAGIYFGILTLPKIIAGIYFGILTLPKMIAVFFFRYLTFTENFGASGMPLFKKLYSVKKKYTGNTGQPIHRYSLVSSP